MNDCRFFHEIKKVFQYNKLSPFYGLKDIAQAVCLNLYDIEAVAPSGTIQQDILVSIVLNGISAKCLPYAVKYVYGGILGIVREQHYQVAAPLYKSVAVEQHHLVVIGIINTIGGIDKDGIVEGYVSDIVNKGDNV